MSCRSVLTAIAISCTFSRIIANDHGPSTRRLGQIKDILCVLLLSGLQKEDMDVNTLKKLERYNVNIHDVNNETLHRECLGQPKLDTESITQQIDMFGDQHIVTIAITDKSYRDMVDKQTPNTSNSMGKTLSNSDTNNETWYMDQKETETSTKANYLSETNNKEEQYKDNTPTLENIVLLWNKYKNSSFYNNKVLADVLTTETSTKSNNGLLLPIEIEYVKNIFRQSLANRNMDTGKKNTTTGQDNYNLVSQKYISEQMAKVKNGNTLIVDRLPQPQLEVIDSNAIFPDKADPVDIKPQIFFGKPNKLSETPKHETILPDQENMNTENLIKNNESQNNNKMKLGDVSLHKTNSQVIKELSSAAATELDQKIIDIGQSLYKNVDKPPLNNNNYIEKSNVSPNIEKLEDWYSNFFRENITIFPTLASNNNRKEFAKESLFDGAYAFNKDNEHEFKSKETQSLSNSPIRENNLTIPYDEPDSEVFDINSLLNNNYRATERSKDMAYSNFYLKGFNPDFLNNIKSPSHDNDEENLSAFDPNQLINNNMNAVIRTPLLTNNPKLKYFNANSPKNKQYRNGGARLGLYRLGNNDYEQFEVIQDVPFIGSELMPENFISSFRKINDPLQKVSLPNNNAEYIEISTETTFMNNDRPFKPTANIGKLTDNLYYGGNFPNIIMNNISVEVKKDIPPIVENKLRAKIFFNDLTAQPVLKNEKAANDIPTFNDDPSRNNINMPKRDLNTVIQGDKLSLIKHSLQYINQILAMNDEVNSSPISNIVNTTSKNQNKPANLDVLKHPKYMPKMMIQSNHSEAKILKMLQGPNDFIKEIAESIKNIILKDIKKEISTETPANSTSPLAAKITTMETTVITTEITIAETITQRERKTEDANYVMQKLLELFKDLKTGTEGTTSTTLKPTSFDTHVSKYVYSPTKNDHPPPMPAFNPYGIKPEIIQTNPYQVYGNLINNCDKDSFQSQMANQTTQVMDHHPQILNQPQQTINQSPRIMNPQMLNQPSQFYNQPYMLNKPAQPMELTIPQNIYHYPSILNQSPKTSYEPLPIINQPPQLTNQELQNIYHFPKIPNHGLKHTLNEVRILNQQPQMIKQAPQTVKETLQTVNRSPQIMDQPRQIMNSAQQMFNQAQPLRNQAPQTFIDSPEMYNQPPQMLTQPSKTMNRAQQMLNEALQMKNQASQMINKTPEMSNRFAQIENQPQKMVNQGQRMRNQALEMMNNYPEMINQRQKYPNSSPQILNQAPQMMYPPSETLNPAPQINAPLTNPMQSYHYVTFQTNSYEIPPLGIPVELPKKLTNHVIIVTTKRPFRKPKHVLKQGETRKWPEEKREEREQNYSNYNKKLTISDSLKHREFREPSKIRSNKYIVHTHYKNDGGHYREPYKQRYTKPDYEPARSHHHAAIKNFHEQLERLEDLSKPEQKRSRERIKDSFNEVPPRQQEPLSKVKQHSKYDDTHFRNFLKTQEKVNDMLEAILATKTSGRAHSVETS